MEEDLSPKVLQSLRHALQTKLPFDSLDSDTKSHLQFCFQILGWLAKTAAKRAEAGAHAEAVRKLEQEAGHLLGISASEPITISRVWSGGRMIEGFAPATGAPTVVSPMARLAAEMGRLPDEAQRQKAQDLFRRFLALEENFVTSTDPEAGGNTAFWTGRQPNQASDTAVDTAVSAERLTQYLKARFPDAPQIRASGVKILPGGFSKDTILFDIEGDESLAGRVVMRKDMPVGRHTSAIDEFPLLQLVRSRGIPVPEPLWAETDKSWFNGAFIIVKFVQGLNDVSGWSGDARACRRFAEMLAEAMVRIHSIRPRDLGLTDAVGATAAEAQHRHILWVLELYRTSSTMPNPRIDAAFGWALANAPALRDQEPSLVHCGLGFHNLLTHNGELCAALDWEFAHFGDPADDLAYSRPFIESLLPWPEFLEIYQSLGGGEFTEEQDKFYAVWRSLRNAASCVDVKKLYLESEYDSLILASAGLVIGPRFELGALREISKAAGLTC